MSSPPEGTKSPSPPSSTAGRGGASGQSPAEPIDMQALAEEIYKLLQRELRLERERHGWRRV